MHKKRLIVPISVLMLSGLTACGNDQGTGVSQSNRNNVTSVGYHTNDRNMVDHDGPLTEIYDYSTGQADFVKNNNNLLPSGYPDDYDHQIDSPLTEYNTNHRVVTNSRNLRDINYHGHLNHRNSKAKASYYTAYEGRFVEKVSNVAASVSNVSDARTIVDGNRVLVSVVLKDNKKAQETKNKVIQAVLPYMNERHYQVTSDLGTYYRIRQLDNELRNGGPKNGIKLDVNDMFDAQEIDKNQQ